MNITEPFVRRPVATTLLSIGVALAGAVSFGLLPASPLPQVDFPTVSVSASLPGASPEVMAATVATPLERPRQRPALNRRNDSRRTERYPEGDLRKRQLRFARESHDVS